jgi:hypothetical protein
MQQPLALSELAIHNTAAADIDANINQSSTVAFHFISSTKVSTTCFSIVNAGAWLVNGCHCIFKPFK